jgi:hypothetical protein
VSDQVVHRRGSSWDRASNYLECSCGWRVSTDLDPRGSWAQVAWLEHVVNALMDERETANG